MDLSNHSGSPNTTWFAVYVKPRHEKAVARVLDGKGFDTFLPLYKRSGKGPELPLFPSYLFGRLNPSDRLQVLNIPGVFFIVSNGNTPAPIEDVEVARIQAIIDSGYPARPWPHLTEGERVRIEDGPLRGIDGLFQRIKDGTGQLIVTVTLLQRAVAVEIDEGWATPVSGLNSGGLRIGQEFGQN